MTALATHSGPHAWWALPVVGIAPKGRLAPFWSNASRAAGGLSRIPAAWPCGAAGGSAAAQLRQQRDAYIRFASVPGTLGMLRGRRHQGLS